MTRREDKRVGLQLNEDFIMWSLCGRSEVKRIYTEINQTGNKRHSSRKSDSESRDNLAMLISQAYKTFPPEVQLCWSSIPGYKLGVMATTLIPQGVWIGPFEGKLVEPDKLESLEHVDGTYLWEIFHGNQIHSYIDGSDITESSWMRFIQCARCYFEQNLNAFQYQDSIYYRVLRDIHVGEELLVWYDDSYPQYMGIPLIAEPLESDIVGTQIKMDTNKRSLNMTTLQINSTVPEAKRLSRDDATSIKPQSKISRTCNSSITLENQTSLSIEKSFNGDDEVFKRTQKHEEILSPTRSMSPVAQSGSESISANSYTKDVFKCAQCYKEFAQRNMLQVHLCPKQTNSPYHCGRCTLSFTNPSDLRSHVVKHVGEKPFKCGFCARSFVGSTTLNNHIRMHTGEKPFNCSNCGVTFSQGAHYARHLRVDCNGNVLTNTCKS